MSVSCDCGGGDYDFFYTADKVFTALATSKRKRCYSCLNLIDLGTDVLEMHCTHPPRSEIEEDIYGDEVPMASKWLCEECGGLYMAITDLGFCIQLTHGETMRELARQCGQGV